MTEPLRQRQPRLECPGFLTFVRGKPCCVCSRPAQAAHVKMTDPRYPEKRPVGMAEKPDDRWCVPLCQGCHLDDDDAQHRGNERAFWERVGIDPLSLACDLWIEFCSIRKPMMEPGVQAEFVLDDGATVTRKPDPLRDPELWCGRRR